MSRYTPGRGTRTLGDLMSQKGKKKLATVTCYDAAFASLIDETDIDLVLVGDSLGNVVLGYDDTIAVTMADMIYHCRSVARRLTKPFLVCDMPFGSYMTTECALKNSVKLIQDGRAQAVKLEGGRAIVAQVEAIASRGIPVVGHLGLTPQSIHSLSGFKIQGREAVAGQRMIDDALALQKAGASLIVLELVPAELADKITRSLDIPTIGIGAGPDCDGQILVLHDLLGFDDRFSPRFLKRYANLKGTVIEALKVYQSDVQGGLYPTKDHSFTSS